MPSPSYMPLRWESSGDQWWFASPIDWAAANGHYDLVRQLLLLDTNLLFKLTSLRRIRRLETVWDDEEQSDDVAKCRCQVARKLLLECETKNGHNSLLRAGYGGWLLYTAASSGDAEFVKELLGRDPLLVFGEGEYGVTDILYAAARSKRFEVFRLLFDSSTTVKQKNGEEGWEEGDSPLGWKMDMRNRAVHAAARGGSVEILRELLLNCSDVLVYRDEAGSTLLHSAAGRGQVEVVKYLLASYDITDSRDDQGNTALHLAAYRGYLPIVKTLISALPSLVPLTNNHGDTFLHMAVAGFRTPTFHRLDPQIELIKQLVCGKFVNIEEIINLRNNGGKTALHVAVSENVRTDLVELLMTVFSIDLNIRDDDGHTPLDLIKRRPRPHSYEGLIKRFISAGGISDCQDRAARSILASRLKTQGTTGSPGTSFRIRDAEIFSCASTEKGYDGNCDILSSGYASSSGEISSHFSHKNKLKFLMELTNNKGRDDCVPAESQAEQHSLTSGEKPVLSLRQRFARMSSLPNNKRVHSVSQGHSSPFTKMKFAAGVRQGVIQVTPRCLFSGSLQASQKSVIQEKRRNHTDVVSPGGSRDFNCLPSRQKSKAEMGRQRNSFNMKVMNQFFCFGDDGVSVNNPGRSKPQVQYCKQAIAA
ncbi:unnamed protein product [Cuscuta europaea]|uniref:Uncharacterized protein n=1 Tax=Cuscuta europaea TaxID=41803 RepID=A0A9P0ZS18_CUSEU|nr:unnamed protein product [Cuscuta europaea]